MVVLCCGTLGSPCVLERSGVGDPAILSLVGVDVKVDLPGVGAEFDDHQLTWGTYHSSKESQFEEYARRDEAVMKAVNEEWEATGQGIAGSNGFDWGYKVRPTPQEIRDMGPIFEKYWKEVGADKPDKPLYSYGTFPELWAGIG